MLFKGILLHCCNIGYPNILDLMTESSGKTPQWAPKLILLLTFIL